MNYLELKKELDSQGVTLVAVSKTQSNEQIMELYNQGQRIFGENKAQELLAKAAELPQDIEWHMVGHLQKNKVKFLLPVVKLIHSVDTIPLMFEINKVAKRLDKQAEILLEVKIAREETKFGLEKDELVGLVELYNLGSFDRVTIKGLMGMATNTPDLTMVRREFYHMKDIFIQTRFRIRRRQEEFTIMSMGMSGDYTIAIEEGSNMVRIGQLLFGKRSNKKEQSPK